MRSFVSLPRGEKGGLGSSGGRGRHSGGDDPGLHIWKMLTTPCIGPLKEPTWGSPLLQALSITAHPETLPAPPSSPGPGTALRLLHPPASQINRRPKECHLCYPALPGWARRQLFVLREPPGQKSQSWKVWAEEGLLSRFPQTRPQESYGGEWSWRRGWGVLFPSGFLGRGSVWGKYEGDGGVLHSDREVAGSACLYLYNSSQGLTAPTLPALLGAEDQISFAGREHRERKGCG